MAFKRPLSATAARKLAKDFIEENTRGSILGAAFAALLSRLIIAFLESLLKGYDIVPKDPA